MTNEICRYHNDLNKVKLPQFNEVQLNLFYHLVHKMRHKKQGEIVRFEWQEIEKMIGNYRQSNETLLGIVSALFTRLFEANFRILLTDEERGLTCMKFVHLFKTMEIYYFTKDETLAFIELETNERFEYLIDEFKANYTEFELAELVSLSGKYTKLIYTHLKQYRATGEWLIKWDDFKEILDIPKRLKPCDIDKRIIKPAIKELTKERTLFDQKRIPFKNLKFEKLTHNKEPNRKRLKPYYIRFTFNKEHSTQSLNVELNGKYFLHRDNLTNKEFIYRVDNIKKEPKKVIIACSVFDKTMNNLSPYFTFDFTSFAEAEKFILENEYKIS